MLDVSVLIVAVLSCLLFGLQVLQFFNLVLQKADQEEILDGMQTIAESALSNGLWPPKNMRPAIDPLLLSGILGQANTTINRVSIDWRATLGFASFDKCLHGFDA